MAQRRKEYATTTISREETIDKVYVCLKYSCQRQRPCVMNERVRKRSYRERRKRKPLEKIIFAHLYT